MVFLRPRPHPRGRDRRGFTLIELLLVTVILGLLATIASPYFARARDRAIATQIKADVRHLMQGLEVYSALNTGQWPTSLAQVESGGSYVSSGDVEYCFFVSVPGTPSRDPYVIAMAGHPGTTTKILIVYPLWGSEMLEFDNGQRGC